MQGCLVPAVPAQFEEFFLNKVWLAARGRSMGLSALSRVGGTSRAGMAATFAYRGMADAGSPSWVTGVSRCRAAVWSARLRRWEREFAAHLELGRLAPGTRHSGPDGVEVQAGEVETLNLRDDQRGIIGALGAHLWTESWAATSVILPGPSACVSHPANHPRPTFRTEFCILQESDCSRRSSTTRRKASSSAAGLRLLIVVSSSAP